MEELFEKSLLYDFYGELLNEHQREIYEEAVFEDLSLGEIAKERGISRQGVHDLIKRCNKALEDYESKLHLVQRFLSIQKKVEQIQVLAHDNGGKPDITDIKQIEQISKEILEEL